MIRHVLLLTIALTPLGIRAEDASQLIDKHIFERIEQDAVKSAGRSSDAEFLRRAYLDIGGVIPPNSVVQNFLADSRADKRARVLDDLLSSSRYVRHFTAFWRNTLMPEVQSNQQVQQLLPGFDAWLRGRLAENTRYDQLVREIITTPLESKGRNQQMMRRGAEQSPIAFFQAKEIAPENLAAATSRIFLGIRIGCAQCHDHPFDKWKQTEFWSYASFFAGIERQGSAGIFGQVEEVFDRRELLIPDTETVVQANYLDGTQPRWKFRVSSRDTLADWLTSGTNPYFARMAVNRVWGKFFGVGLVDPVDDFTEHNPCSHPELLDALAAEFVKHDFDVKFLIRSIVNSRAYQLTSARPEGESYDPQHFAVMPVKGMSGGQLFDSLAEATGFFEEFQVRRPNMQNGSSPQTEIMELFANDTDPVTEQQTSILQALAMMNGAFTSGALDLQNSRTLAGIADFPMSPEERVDSLFLSTLSRRPTERERAKFADYVKSGGATKDQRRALADVFWALLNSTEFMTNH